MKKIISQYEYQREQEALNTHAIISTTNACGEITSVNSTFCEISGYSATELLGQNHRLVKSEYHTECFYSEIWQTIVSGKIWQGDICNKTKNGDHYWVKSTIIPFVDSDGKAYKYLSYHTDITSLKQNNDRLSLTVSGTGDAIWDWDITTGVFIVSSVYESMLGYEKGELLPHIDSWIKSVHPEDLLRAEKLLYDYFEQKITSYEVELRLRCKNDSWKWIFCRGKIIHKDPSGKPLTMMGLHTDISARKAMEAELRHEKQLASQANEAKSQFLSSMSHELRTPLNAILGFAQLLESDNDPPLTGDQKESIDYILSSGRHLLSLINSVLELSTIESGKLELSIERLQLLDVINNSLSLLKPIADDCNIKIHVASDMTVAVNADFTRLKQVIINLVNNAIKYNHKNGSVIIDWQYTENNTVKVTITDTGFGIAPKNQHKVFGAFNRLGQENTNIEGTGIGLVVTKDLIEIMGGQIGFDSIEGKGSTFWFELPFID